MKSWYEYTVRYEVRRIVGDVTVWETVETRGMGQDAAINLAADLNADGGRNIRNAVAVRKVCIPLPSKEEIG